MFAGHEPFAGVDAIFISHYHGDHFSAEDILRLLKTQTAIHLYALMQAVIMLRTAASDGNDAVFDRVHPVTLAFQDPPVSMAMDGLFIEAVRIPIPVGLPAGSMWKTLRGASLSMSRPQ